MSNKSLFFYNKLPEKLRAFIKELAEWIIVLVVAFLVAFLVNNFILSNSFIPTPSMERTLPVGSRIFGFRLNYLFTDVKRGDIVIFDYGYNCKECKKMYQKNDENKCPYCNAETKGSEKVHYIKRAIGLPGDHIEIKPDYIADSDMFIDLKFNEETQVPCGHVYINGEQYIEPYLNEPMVVDSNLYKGIDLVVPEGSYFLLGDNRNNSEDARFWPNHFVTKKDIEAKAYFIYWPLSKFGLVK